MALVITEWRLESLRRHIVKHAVDDGIESGIEIYKREYNKGEHLALKKRKIRDKKIQEYIRKLDAMMQVEQ